MTGGARELLKWIALILTCRLAGLSRDAFRHEPDPAPATQALSARLVELAQTYRRFGYRRLHDLLRPARF